MIKQFVCLCVLATALASDFPCHDNFVSVDTDFNICDENFPFVTDFSIGDCNADDIFYDPACYYGCIPGCRTIKGVGTPSYPCGNNSPCPPGYYCVDIGKPCQVDEESCLKYYNAKDYKNTRWRPDCRKSDGAWEAKQCKDDRCFCYDSKGNRIFGQAFANQASNMTCACSRKRAELEADPDYYFVSLHCDDMGNYEPLQCVNGQCWCAEPKTGNVLTPTIPEKMMSRLPCYNKEDVGSQYLRACESQVYAQEKIRDELRAHGTTRTNFPHLRCLYDGSFGPTRIENGIVSCVWRDNTAIGYSADLSGAVVADIDCNCARDSKIYAAIGLQLLRTCLANGNYDPVQRDGDDYYCVDRDGFRISGIRQEEYTAEDCRKIK